MPELTNIALGLGSNLENRTANLNAAVGRLSGRIVEGLVCSSFFLTDPVDCPAGTPSFLNAAVAGTTFLSPADLLDRCQALERAMGRPHYHACHSDRIIDIDILLYGQLTEAKRRLTIPHPQLMGRAFVLEPLCEIVPDWPVGAEGKTVAVCWAELSGKRP